MRPIYIKDFEKFLKHTDEKQILLKRISAEIKRNNIKKLLDIGAGNGLLAIPLSRQVFEYTAIEPKKDYINILKKYGLKVIERKFPDNKIVDIYDGILISHVISYENDNYKKFIASAWKLLKPGGFLFIITHKGEKNEWTKLLEKIDLCEIIYSQNSFEKMKILLKSLGNFKFKKIISHVNADNVNDLVQALSFVASDGIPVRKKNFLSKRKKITEILNKKYHKNGKYSFPFNHFFFIIKKPNK